MCKYYLLSASLCFLINCLHSILVTHTFCASLLEEGDELNMFVKTSNPKNKKAVFFFIVLLWCIATFLGYCCDTTANCQSVNCVKPFREICIASIMCSRECGSSSLLHGPATGQKLFKVASNGEISGSAHLCQKCTKFYVFNVHVDLDQL